MAGLCAGGELAQTRPALPEERAGARLVAGERSAAASSAKFRSASWRARLRMQRDFGTARECPAGGPRSAWPRARPSQALGELRRDGLAPGFRRRGCAIVHAEPLAPVAAHVLDQRRNRHALRRQRVLHARRHLGVGVALDNALLLEGAEAQREGPRADAGQRALELAEAATALGKVANHKDRPLATDDVRSGTDWACGIGHMGPVYRKTSGTEVMRPAAPRGAPPEPSSLRFTRRAGSAGPRRRCRSS